MIKAGTDNGQTAQMNVVMNWFEELKRRVPENSTQLSYQTKLRGDWRFWRDSAGRGLE
jgi:hypothetical protein